MRDAAAIIAPAVDLDQITRSILKEHIALQDDERNADAHEKKSIGYREAAARRRVEIGRMLIEAKRGIKHGGWLPYLEKLGIGERSARDWMALAGHVETKSEPNQNGSDLERTPTRREVNEARKTAPRDEQPDPPVVDEDDHDEPLPTPAPTLDIDAELSRIQNKICQFAESVPPKARKLIAHELRETAKLIEGMQ